MSKAKSVIGVKPTVICVTAGIGFVNDRFHVF
jgi:hypothetical protein